jgi:GT2 family glycosyltransferase
VQVEASIVLYHHDPDRLMASIRALAAQSQPVARVRVLVNDDPAGSLGAAVERAIASADLGVAVDVVSVGSNLGFSGGHNRMLEAGFAAGSDVMVVHNPDLVLDPAAVAALVQATGGSALAGPVLELADPATLVGEGRVDTLGIRWTWDGRHLDAGQGQPWPPDRHGQAYPVAGVSGACIAVPRRAYDTIVHASDELFDEDFIAYREDAELAYRAGLLGVRSVVAPAARGRHGRSLRGTARGSDPWIDRLGVRNRFLIAFKYGWRRPGSMPGPLVRDLVVIIGVLLRERSSVPGLREAWALRARMRAKGRRVLAARSGGGRR